MVKAFPRNAGFPLWSGKHVPAIQETSRSPTSSQTRPGFYHTARSGPGAASLCQCSPEGTPRASPDTWTQLHHAPTSLSVSKGHGHCNTIPTSITSEHTIRHTNIHPVYKHKAATCSNMSKHRIVICTINHIFEYQKIYFRKQFF